MASDKSDPFDNTMVQDSGVPYTYHNNSNGNVAGTDTPPMEVPFPGLIQFSAAYAKYHGYLAAVICIWAIAANLANIVVLTRKHMLSSTNLILTWLAVADLLTMSSYLPVSIHFYIMKDPRLEFPSTKSIHWIYFMLFHVNFTVVCHTVAIWLTITLAIFRYMYICYPTKGPTICSMERAKLAVGLTCLCVAIICIPNYLVNTKKTASINETVTFANGTNGTQEMQFYEFTSTHIAEPYLSKINYWIQALLIKLIPCTLLTLLTILLIVAMHQANQRRMKLKSQGKKAESDRAGEHNRTTGMLLAVVALFLLTELPQGILTLCNIFIPSFFENVYWPLGDLLDMLAMLNNSINFVLYCTMSRQFRDTFVDIFCRCCKTNSAAGWMKVKTVTVTANGATTTSAV